jgi:hypothetical protein
MLVMLKAFLKTEGTGDGANDYRYSLYFVKQKLDYALACSHMRMHMSKVYHQDRHIIKENLTYKNACSLAETKYRCLFHDKK